MSDPQQLHRTANAVSRAIAPGADDFDHPGHDELAAYIDARLGDVEREIVETHLADCARCREDVSDLRDVQRELTSGTTRPAPPARLPAWQWAAAVATVAALVVVAVRISRGPATPVPSTLVPAAPSSGAKAPVSTPDPLDTAERRFVDDVTAEGVLRVPPEVRALQGPVGTLLGRRPGAAPMAPLVPSATAVESSSPVFSWSPVAGAESYVVSIFDDQFKEVAASGPLRSTSWTPSTPLPRAVQLAWQVTARVKGGHSILAPAPPQPEARFIVAPEILAVAVSRQRERIAGHPLELGILLARAGMLDDAEVELRKAATDPATADRAKTLLATLRK